MCLLILFLLCGVVLASDESAHFREHTIAADLRGGYQVVAVDLNKDGRKDLIALGSQMRELVWFENPGWERHVITTGLSRMINLAAWDWDGDGIPEIVLASDFSMEPAKSIGTVWVLKHKGDPRAPWSITEIDRLPTSHRLRCANLDGQGRVVINAPLAGAKASSPDYKEKVPIVFYRPAAWKREMISDELEGVAHGIAVVDWDGDGSDELLTASFQGIHLFRPDTDGRWSRTLLAEGSPEPWPRSGSSDIAAGQLGRNRFLCAIEPWHGNQVAVYTRHGNNWQRTVIDDSLAHGHALLTADLNGDGRDEIIAGYREGEPRLYIYSASDESGRQWTRSLLDGAIPAAACDVADLNGDGHLDIVCIGGSYLKWYENRR